MFLGGGMMGGGLNASFTLYCIYCTEHRSRHFSSEPLLNFIVVEKNIIIINKTILLLICTYCSFGVYNHFIRCF